MARRRSSWFSKLLFFINSIFAVLLLLAYLLPFIPPKTFPLLSVLNLGMPVLIGVNFVFLVYWLIRLKRYVILPLVVLLLGVNHVLSLYKLGGEEALNPGDAEMSIMSYNVRQFDHYNWLTSVNVPQKLEEFFERYQPDILCIQEYYQGADLDFSNYPYHYTVLKSGQSGQVIYSKYKIINTHSLDFPHTANNAIYADIVVNADTLRIINMHLESLKIHPTLGTFEAKTGKRMWKRMAKAFAKQQGQVEKISQVIKKSPYPVMVCGDMNNSAFSYVYHELSAQLKDAFTEAGEGFGRTFAIDYIPLRIDVILVPETYDVVDFKTFQTKLSDHYPIMAWLKLPKS